MGQEKAKIIAVAAAAQDGETALEQINRRILSDLHQL